MAYITLKKEQYDDLCDLIVHAYKGDTDIKAVLKQMDRIKPIDDPIELPKIVIDSWKKEEQIWIDEVSELKGKLQTALNVLKSIEWQKDPYIENIRPFLTAAITTIENTGA